MGRRNKEEKVFVSFHYLSKGDGSPFTIVEFENLCEKIKNSPRVDIRKEENVALMRSGILVPLSDYQKLNDLMVFGAFHATYSGHSYENNEKGKISSRSLNIRKFHYLLYLSKNGRIYIGAQYLGTFGGYGDVRLAIQKLLPSGLAVNSTAIRSLNYAARNVSPKEVKLTIERPTEVKAGKRALHERMVLSLQRAGKGSPFEDVVRDDIISLFKLALPDRKKALFERLKNAGLAEFDEDELANCNIVVDVDGRQQTMYLFDNGVHATKFDADVVLTSEGHPEPEQLKQVMRELLSSEIINAGKG